MVKKILCSILLALVLLALFSGCAEVVSTEVQEVEAVVYDHYYKPMYMQPVKVGKVNSFITHPAQHYTYVSYGDIKETFSGAGIYRQYKIGDTIVCNLITTYYDDNTLSYKLEYKKE